MLILGIVAGIVLMLTVLGISMLIIETIVNYHRNKLREYDFYRHDWFLELGLFETAELVVEDIKNPITWFGKKDWKREWIDN